MDKTYKALLAGASGLIGSSLLHELLNGDVYSEIEVWSRNSLGISHPKLKEKIIDFNEIIDIPSSSVDHVFCCLGTTIKKAKSQEAFRKVDFEYVVELAKYAEISGASKFFVISSLGANKDSATFYLRTKGEMEESLKHIFLPAVYILRPSLLLGKRKEFRFGEIIAQGLAPVFGLLLFGKLKKYKGIKASTIAKAMLHLAKEDGKGLIILDSDKIQEAGK